MVAGGPACAHCGLPVPAGLAEGRDGRAFCCGGCSAAWRLLHEGGFAEFYRLRDATADRPGRPAGDDPAAAGFASPAFRAAWTRKLPGGGELIDWYLDGLHCPACVWLVEQLPRLLPGVRWARLDLGTAQLRVAYDPAAAPPDAQAALLSRLGYRARPFRADAVVSALAAEHRDLLLRVAVAAASAVGAMHLAATLSAGELTGDLDPGWRAGFAWGAILAAAPACLWAGAPLHRGAVAALRHARWSVDLAASLAIALAMVGSAALAAGGSQASYADAAAMFAALLLTARLAVVQARRRVARAAGGLAGLLPPTARRRRGTAVEETAIEALAAGDEVELDAGAVAPGDGTVIAGDGAVDIAVLTGEPRPVAVGPGDAVAAGATCRAGRIVVRLVAVGPATRLAGILARAVPPPRAADADEDQAGAALRWFAPAALTIAGLAGLAWGWQAGWAHGAAVALAVVVAACPCALGMAAPLSLALATAAAARRGLLIRDPAVLARIPAVVHVVCDKTGTLTTGRMAVAAWDGGGGSEALALAERSGHPAAQAVAAHLRAAGVVPATLATWQEVPGRGVIGQLDDGRQARLGGTALTGVAAAEGGRSRIGISLGNGLAGAFDLDDPPRSGSAAVVAAWRDAGAAVHLASGDHPLAAAALAARLGIADAQGGLPPEGKAELVRSLRRSGGAVAAVGDGINDAAMLAEADVAVAIGGGLEAAADRCHVFCTRPDEAGPALLWHGAARLRRDLGRLLTVSAIYNLLAIGGAAAGLFGPLVCAIAMPLSSLTVVALALRARPFDGD